jgi:triacylglycerol lipase
MLYFVSALLAPFVVFALGVFFYVTGSYLFARSHLPRSVSFWAFARAMMREFAWTLAVQPFLPLYYFVGRRMGRRRKAGDLPRRPVIFVHGYMQNRVGFVVLARELVRRGFADLFGFNYPWWASVGSSARRLAKFVERVCEECGTERVDLVCHSMGGLVALEYLRTVEGVKHVERCATIASPHGGVKWPGPLLGRSGTDLKSGFIVAKGEAFKPETKLLSVFSTHDNVVHPSATSSLASYGGTDLEIGAMGHFTILFDRRAVAAVADFLAAEAA